MIFRLTQATQKKLKTGRLPSVPGSVDPVDEWYVNVFHCNRYKYIVTTHAATLFTVFMHGAGIKNVDDYIGFIFSAIAEQMRDVSLEPVYERIVAKNSGEVILSATNSRPILGSMNDMVQMTKYLFVDENISPFDAGKFINTTPFSYIGMDHPLERMRRYLDSA